MWYAGKPIHRCQAIMLVAPPSRELAAALARADLEAQQKAWFERARAEDTILYFAIQRDKRLIGQVLLHDRTATDALVGYHLFFAADRRRGYGTEALSALCEFAFARLALLRLVAITDVGNEASRRIAIKCGFREIGAAREGPHLVCYERAKETPMR